MELAFDPVELLQTDGTALIDVVRGFGTSTPVPSCPGWTLADLARHQTEVWNFWGRMVADRATDLDAVRAIGDSMDDGEIADDLVVDALATAHNQLYSALAQTPPDTEIWTWTGRNRDAAWVRRRMAHETAVHRWDAENAAGRPYEISTAVAADGIDEYLEFFLGRRRADDAADVGGTVHLHCTDTDESHTAGGEWFVSQVDVGDVVFTREHTKGDAAIRGEAADLLLWLWRRDDGADSTVDVIGDAEVAARFRAFPGL